MAKCYGQRLRVATAKRVATVTATATATTATTEDDNAATTAGNDPTPLRPHHIIEAYEHCVRAGLDPGFWMMGNNTTTIGGGRGRSTCNSVTECNRSSSIGGKRIMIIMIICITMLHKQHKTFMIRKKRAG